MAGIWTPIIQPYNLNSSGESSWLGQTNGIAARWQFMRHVKLIRIRQDVVAYGEISALQTTFSSHVDRMLPLGAIFPTGQALEGQWDSLCALEMIGAYTAFYEMALERVRTSSMCASTTPQPRDLFLPGTAAYTIMSSEDAAVVRPITTVILLNIMLFEQRGCIPEEAIYQYWALRRKFRLCDIELGSGPAYLTFALGLKPDMKVWQEPSQMALLARMLSVEVRLTQTTQQRLKDSLLSFVTASTADEADRWWSPRQLHDRVHEELLKS
jgi:hypothetical protein